MSRDSFAEQFREALPPFLNREDYDRVVAELEKYPDTSAYYEKAYQYYETEESSIAQKVFQGDGWHSIPIRDPVTGASKTVSGIVLSNTCDIDPENVGRPSRRVVIAPLIPLERYEAKLRRIKSNESVRGTLDQVRQQRPSYTFYLPATPISLRERVVILDDLYSVPLDEFERCRSGLAFRLNYLGILIFRFKLQIHFLRPHEGPIRSAP